MAYFRRLSFFDEKLIDIPLGSNNVFQIVHPTCTTYGRGFVWSGDSNGVMHRVDRTLSSVSFEAHKSNVQHAYQMKNHDLLITIGDDEPNVSQLKVWNLSKWVNKITPFCCRTTATNPVGLTPSRVTYLVVDEGLQYMVTGHESGAVQLFKGDITKERNCKRQIIYEFLSPITGLGLYIPNQMTSKNLFGKLIHADQPNQQTGPILFASTVQSIMSFVLGKRDDIQSTTVLDRFGVAPNCTAMLLSNEVTGANPQFAVACPDAVYFYNWDGRGPCLAMDGEKSAIEIYKNYLIIVRNCNAPNQPNSDQIIIQDYMNKFVAGEFSLNNFSCLFIEWDGIYALCNGPLSGNHMSRSTGGLEDGGTSTSKLICFTEKDTQTKLEMLYAKKNFNLAIEVANSQHLSDEEIAHIVWRYAEHLYKQKDYDASVEHYIKTIGKIESSFVIQKFLESSHILQLTRYLEAMLDLSCITSDHCILLLNCYCRLQNQEKIEQFVKKPIQKTVDIQAAIRILKQSNYLHAAISLIQANDRPVEAVGLFIRDLNDGQNALKIINLLPFNEALQCVCEYGNLLMSQYPDETLQLLNKLCTYPDAHRINVQHFHKIFINNQKAFMRFLQGYINNMPSSKVVNGVVDTLLELLLFELDRLLHTTTDNDNNKHAEQKEKLLDMIMNLLRNSELSYDPKKALLLCYQHKFYHGCLYLWEKEALYNEILRYHVDVKNSEQVLDTCIRFGDQMPKLWLNALHYFADKQNCSEKLAQVINKVDSYELASSLDILDILTKADEENCCTLGTIRPYLLEHLTTGSESIKKLQNEVDRLREETTRNREVVRAINNHVKIFQQQKCALCHQSLDTPSVHFLCDHSFHRMCFDNYSYGDQQCPECAPANKKLLSELNDFMSNWSSSITIDGQRTVNPHQSDQIISQISYLINSNRHKLEFSHTMNNTMQRVISLPTNQFSTVLSTSLAHNSISPFRMNSGANSLSENVNQSGSNAVQNNMGQFSKSHTESTATVSRLVTMPSTTTNTTTMSDKIVQKRGTNPFSTDSSPDSLGYNSLDKEAKPDQRKVSTNPFDDYNSADEDTVPVMATDGIVPNSNNHTLHALSDCGLGDSVSTNQASTVKTPFD